MTTTDEESTLVYSFPRGENEEIQMTLKKYKGRFYIDLRLWFQSPDQNTFFPTKKGVSFSVERLPELKEGVKQLGDACLKIKPEAPQIAEKRQQPVPASQPRRQPNAWAGRNSG